MKGLATPLGRAYWRARAALLWERWAPALWPLAALIAGFAALSLLNVWPLAGETARLAALAAAVLSGLGWGLWRLWRSPRMTDADIWRRVEADSRFSDRPLEALSDAPASGDSALWAAHQARARRVLSDARARRPFAAIAASDAFAARFAALAALILGIGVAGDQAGARLAGGFALTPQLESDSAALIDAWLNPPAYTGAPPVFLTAETASPVVRAPVGSEFVLRASGVDRAPVIRVGNETRQTRFRAEALDKGVYEARLPVDETLRVRAAGYDWRLIAQPDATPGVTFTKAPETAPNGAFRVFLSAADDHGLTKARLDLALADDPRRVESEDLGLFAAPAKSFDSSVELDLTGHPWAGRAVRIRLSVTDSAGQTGFSDWRDYRLPQRVFVEPLARAVVEQRGLLLSETRPYQPALPPARPGEASLIPEYDPDSRIERAPDSVRRAAAMIEALTYDGATYFDDSTVFLGLSQAGERIKLARNLEALEPLPADLWAIALRAETGDLASAEAALRAAERALTEALARGAGMDELTQLFEALRQAINRYMEALAANAEMMDQAAQGPADLDTSNIEDLLEAIRDSAELGDSENAATALQALSNLLRNMQVRLTRGQGGQSGSGGAQADMEALEELSDLIGRERGLMDETLRELDQGPAGAEGGDPAPGGDGDPPEIDNDGRAGDLAERQAEIGEALRALREQLGDEGAGAGGESGTESGGDENGESGPALGESLERAGRAAESAENALREGDGEGALSAQREAIEALRDSAAALARRMMEGQSAGDGDGTDPLGRSGGGFGGGGPALPDEAERKRAREILEEIRRRASERGRPQEELEYYDRLLERF